MVKTEFLISSFHQKGVGVKQENQRKHADNQTSEGQGHLHGFSA